MNENICWPRDIESCGGGREKDRDRDRERETEDKANCRFRYNKIKLPTVEGKVLLYVLLAGTRP